VLLLTSGVVPAVAVAVVFVVVGIVPGGGRPSHHARPEATHGAGSVHAGRRGNAETAAAAGWIEDVLAEAVVVVVAGTAVVGQAVVVAVVTVTVVAMLLLRASNNNWVMWRRDNPNGARSTGRIPCPWCIIKVQRSS
jgi:hypothetical protein